MATISFSKDYLTNKTIELKKLGPQPAILKYEFHDQLPKYEEKNVLIFTDKNELWRGNGHGVALSKISTSTDKTENGFNNTGSENETSGINVINGKDGKDGKDGINGKDGKDGINGKDGKDGVDGKNGTDGVDGTDGFSPTIKVNKQSDTEYILEITTAAGSFKTPNLISRSTAVETGSSISEALNVADKINRVVIQ